MELVAGLGNRIRFWHDIWCGDAPLKALFPLIFVCSIDQSTYIDSHLLSSGVGEGRTWNITFFRDFNDWEVDEVLAFFTFIHSKIPAGLNPDSMRWKLRQHGEFDVKSLYHALDVKIDIKFPWKAIWRAKVPRRVSFFVWSAAWGKILTCDNLMRRCYTMVGWCCMCRTNGENWKPSFDPLPHSFGLVALDPAFLAFFGCFLTLLLIFSLAGLIVLVNTILLFGTWCLFA